MLAPAPGETFRFNDFELDVAAYQLRRQGRVVRLERQPMDVADPPGRAPASARLTRRHRRAPVGQGRVRRRRHGSPYGHPEDSPGARRFDQCAGLCRDGAQQGLSLRCGRRGRLPYVRLGVGRGARGTFAGAGTPADERRRDRRTPWSRIDRESGRGTGACGRRRRCSGVATMVGASGACPDGGGGRRPVRPGRVDPAQRGRASHTGHARRAALRGPAAIPSANIWPRVSPRRPARRWHRSISST